MWSIDRLHQLVFLNCDTAVSRRLLERLGLGLVSVFKVERLVSVLRVQRLVSVLRVQRLGLESLKKMERLGLSVTVTKVSVGPATCSYINVVYTATVDHIAILTVGRRLPLTVTWSVMFILALLQSRTHVDTVQNFTSLDELEASEHLYGFFPVCTLIWLFRCLHLLKDLPPIWHLYAFCPLWIVMCVARFPAVVHCLLQKLHSNGFSPEWLRVCLARSVVLSYLYSVSICHILCICVYQCEYSCADSVRYVMKNFSHIHRMHTLYLQCVFVCGHTNNASV